MSAENKPDSINLSVQSGEAERILIKKDSLTPIFSTISEYSGRQLASFHTPGHKGHAGLLEGIKLLNHDLTELPLTFDLFDASSKSDVVSLSEKLAANAFGAYDSFYSATGCTPCIQTMIFVAAKNCGLFAGKKLLAARNAHKSLVNVCGLLNLDVAWVYGDDSSLDGGQITTADIRAALKKYGEKIGAVYITSPDYYGRIADVADIARLCDDWGIPLLVDNAHGSHLGAFDIHPITLGASATADSLHKTLPVLTGGAILHVSQKAYDSYGFKREHVKPAMERFSSSSPSFPILASIDLARDWWKRAGSEIYNRTKDSVEKIRTAAGSAGVMFLETAENSRFVHDPTRIVVRSGEMDITGAQAADFLREYGCEPEFFDDEFCVLIVTPFNTPDELRLLEEGLVAFGIANKRGRFWRKRKAKKDDEFLENPFKRPIQQLSINKAITSKTSFLPIDEAKDKISASTVCTCPPGIPIVVPGEDINEYAISMMKKSGFTHIEVVS